MCGRSGYFTYKKHSGFNFHMRIRIWNQNISSDHRSLRKGKMPRTQEWPSTKKEVPRTWRPRKKRLLEKQVIPGGDILDKFKSNHFIDTSYHNWDWVKKQHYFQTFMCVRLLKLIELGFG